MNQFDYNASPTPEMVEHMKEVREVASHLAMLILRAKNGRETSLALTNLEQAAMWANKAITRAPSEY